MPQDEANRINIRRLTASLTNQINSYVEDDNAIGKRASIDRFKAYLMGILHPMQLNNAIVNYDTTVDGTDDGKLNCAIMLQPTRTAEMIYINLVLDSYLNSIFYIKMIDGIWNICTLRDIYEPNYEPIAAIIGDTEYNWEVCTIESLLDRGVPLDEIKVYRENIGLRPKWT
jgi:hypothetical protein